MSDSIYEQLRRPSSGTTKSASKPLSSNEVYQQLRRPAGSQSRAPQTSVYQPSGVRRSLTDLPFTPESFQHSIDLGIGAVKGKNGESIDLRTAMSMMGSLTGEAAFKSSKPSWQLEDDLNGMNAELATRTRSRYVGDPREAAKPVSDRFFEFTEDVRRGLDEGYYGMARGQRWFMERVIAPFVGNAPASLNPVDIGRWSDSIGEAPDLRNDIQSKDDWGLQAWRTLYNIPVSAVDMMGLGAKIVESPQQTPEILKGVWDGLVESVNVFDPNATPAEKFGRTLNAAMLVVGALEGASAAAGKGARIRTRFEAKAIAKEFGIGLGEAESLVNKTRTTLAEASRSKSAIAPFAQDVQQALFGRTSKDVAVELRTRMAKFSDELQSNSSARVGAAPSEVIGATDRIEFAPLAAVGDVQHPSVIVQQLFEELNQTAPRKGKVRWGEAAKYNDDGTIVLGRDNDLRNVSHELGHHLSEMFEPLIKAWAKPRTRSPFDAELNSIPLGRELPKSWTLAQKRYERAAEFVRLYMLNPDEAQRLAPGFYEHFESVVPENIRGSMTKAGEQMRQFLSQSTPELVKATVRDRIDNPSKIKYQDVVDAVVAAKEPMASRAQKPFDTTLKTKINQWVNNDRAALDEAAQYVDAVAGRKDVLPDEDLQLLARKQRYVDGAVAAVLEEGIRDVHGNVVLDPVTGQELSLKTILEPLQTIDEQRDMLAAGVSERIVSESDRILESAQHEVEGIRKRIDHDTQHIERLTEMVKDAPGDDKTTRMVRGIISRTEKSIVKKEAQIKKVEADAKIRSQKLSNAGAGGHDPIRLHRDYLDELAKSDPEKYGRIQESLRRYREFSTHLMQFALDSGLITKEHFDNMFARADSYFDLGRVVDDTASTLGLTEELNQSRRALGVKDALGKFKGSTKDFESGIVNLAFNVRAILNMAERNNLVGALVNPLTDPALTPVQKNLLSSVATRVKSGDGGADAVSYMRAGVKERWQLHPAIAATFNGSQMMTANTWYWRLAELPNRLLRDGVTFVPAFVGRNYLRDFQERLIKAKPGTKGKAGETIRAYRATDAEIAEYDYYGGGLRHQGEDAGTWSGFARAQREAAIRADIEGYRVWAPKKALSKYNEFRERVERSNRLVEFNRVRDARRAELIERNTQLAPDAKLSPERIEHLSRLAGGQAARDLIDFAESGVYAKAFNRFVTPFTTAAIAGTRSSVKAFRANPGRYLMNVFITQGSLLIAQEAWNASQGATDKYEQQPAYLKDMFVLFYVPGADGFVRIPKPHLEGVLTSGLRRASRGDWDGYFENLHKALIPMSAESAIGNPMSQTVAGVMGNYDSFRQAPIVNRWEEGLDLSLRDSSSASGAGQLLQALTGKDARLVDYIGRGLLGNSASTVQQLSNVVTPGKTGSAMGILNTLAGVTTDSADYSARDVVHVGELAKKSGAQNPLKPLLDAVRAAEKSGDIQQVKATREQLYSAAGQIRRAVAEGTKELRGVERWRATKAILGS